MHSLNIDVRESIKESWEQEGLTGIEIIFRLYLLTWAQVRERTPPKYKSQRRPCRKGSPILGYMGYR